MRIDPQVLEGNFVVKNPLTGEDDFSYIDGVLTVNKLTVVTQLLGAGISIDFDAIDATPVGGETPDAGTFTDLIAEDSLTVGETELTEAAVEKLEAVTSTAEELSVLDAAPVAFTIDLAASATVDGIDGTIQAVDAAGDPVAGVFLFEFHVSEAATGIGLTADTISGDLTWGTGTEWDQVTDKKRYRVLTAADGSAVFTIVDSAQPADQYFVVVNPFNAGKLIPSAASAALWLDA